MAWQDQDTGAADDATNAAEGTEVAGELPIEGAANPEAAENAISMLMEDAGNTEAWWMLWESIGWPVTKAIILIIVVLMVSSWVKRVVTGIARKARVEETLARFFGNLVKYAMMILGGLAVLQTFGINTTSFAAVLAAAGFALGMALSGTLGNFASGVMLLIFRPFRVGDVINAAGITAKVDEIGLFSTTFDTVDNRRIIVPNGSIYGGTIENISHHDLRRADVAVGTDYSADLDKTREVLMSAATSVEGGLQDPEPVVYLSELGGSSIDWSVRVWCNAADYWAVKERATRDIKVALDNAGIGIPFPQRDIHVPEAIQVKVTND